MKTALSVLALSINLCVIQIVTGVSKDNKLCPQPNNSAPTRCTDECMNDQDCDNPAICCPGFCYEPVSGKNDNMRPFNVCLYPDVCASGTVCKNGALCMPQGILKYECYCKAGYNGTNCETEINECDPNPCKNGGVCTDLIGDYTCCCEPGYTGVNCEQETYCQSTCSREICPNFQNAICRSTPRFFIKDDNGMDVDVTDYCSMP